MNQEQGSSSRLLHPFWNSLVNLRKSAQVCVVVVVPPLKSERRRLVGVDEELRHVYLCLTGSSDGPLAGQTRAVKTGATATSATPQTKSPTSSLSLKHGNTAAVLDDDEEAHYVDVAQELIVPEGELSSVKELAFAFQRAASRLLEVRRETAEGWSFCLYNMDMNTRTLPPPPCNRCQVVNILRITWKLVPIYMKRRQPTKE